MTREEIEVVLFHSALATRRDGEIVVALFDGNPMRCVAMFRGSPEAVFALAEELGSALESDAE